MYPLVLILDKTKSRRKIQVNREIKSLPMVALRGMTIMPEMVVHFDVSREKSIAAIQEAMERSEDFSCGTKINRNRRSYTGGCL